MQSAEMADAANLLALEALYLDERQWDDWLALFTEDAIFWLPAWKAPYEIAEDPELEMSLIYMRGTAAFKERIWRVRSGLSRASQLTSRTVHMLSGLTMDKVQDGSEVRVRSAATTHVYIPDRHREHTYFGRYEHVLRNVDGAWKIAKKTARIANDRIPTMLDFYNI